MRTTCTRTQVGARHRSPRANASVLLSLNFLLSIIGGSRGGGCRSGLVGVGGGGTHSCWRVHIPTRCSEMMNFLSPPCTVTLSGCGAAPQRIADCRRRLVACGVQTSACPADPPSCRRTLHVGAPHQFQSVSFPLHSTRRKQPAVAGTIAHVCSAQRIFLLPSLDAQIFPRRPVAFEPRRAAAAIFLSGRRPRRRLKSMSVRCQLIYPGIKVTVSHFR